MLSIGPPLSVTVLLSVFAAALPSSARGEIWLIGTARLAGDSTDLSGLAGVLEGGIPHNRVSEILAVNSHEFLVLERDGRGGAEAVTKKIFRIDVEGATDITGRDSLPASEIPDGVTAVRKALFLDLLAPEFGLSGPAFSEKVEGLAFGPDLPDGRRLLVVAIDNDFIAEKPIVLHAFAIDRDDLPRFGW
jgi:hypothetical protein